MQHLYRFVGVVCLFCVLMGQVGAGETEHVLLVTMDGFRWQELFGGADQRLINKEQGGVEDSSETRERFWRESPIERRELLMPFFWQTIVRQGQVWGNPDEQSVVRVTNGHFFSYPGYHELLCGFGEPKIDSNDKKPNPNVTVLEWLHRQPGFAQRVAAFGSWDVFPFILNQERSGIPVNAGWQELDFLSDEPSRRVLNELIRELPRPFKTVRYDAITFRGALDYLTLKHPRVLYVSLGETDDWAHAGRYDLYLRAAQRNDAYIRQLWEAMQAIPEYRGKTTLILTTDHGRGDARDGWKSHGKEIPGSDLMWIAVLGPDVTEPGMMKGRQVTQSQVAATVAAVLGRDFAATDSRIDQPLIPIRE